MSLSTKKVTIGTTPTLIASGVLGRGSVTVVNEGTTLIRLGGPVVTMTGAGQGIPLPGVLYSQFTYNGDDEIYGIVATGTADVSVLENN